MTGYLISAAVLILLFVFEAAVYRVASRNLKGKTFWAGLLTAAGWGVGLGIGLIPLVIFWAPLTSGVLAIAGSASVPPLTAAIGISILVITAIWIVYAMLKVWAAEVWGNSKDNKAIPALKWAAVFFSIFAVINLTGIASSSSPWLWTWRVTIMLVAVWVGIVVIRKWFPKGQDRWGAVITYIIACAATVYCSSALGWSIFANIEGSLYSLSFFLAFNLGIFWFCFGLSDPTKRMKDRIGVWLAVPYLLLLTVICFYVMVMQATGRVTWVEQEVVRLRNAVAQGDEDLQRQEAAYGISLVKADFEQVVIDYRNATTDADRQAALRKSEAAKRAMDKYYENQKQVKRADKRVPEEIGKDWGKLKGLFSDKSQLLELNGPKDMRAAVYHGGEIKVVGTRVKWLRNGGSEMLPPGNHRLRRVGIGTNLTFQGTSFGPTKVYLP